MVREFKLVNKKGQEYSLMDIKNYCLLTEPSGLGYSYSTEYEQLGNIFIEGLRSMVQGHITGTLNFINYDNYRKFVDFIESSEDIKFSYKIPFEDNLEEFFKDVNIESIGKTEKQKNGLISEEVSFDCLSLWYQDKETVYTVGELDELLWDFAWDSRFADYTSRSVLFENNGHIEAPFKVEMSDFLIKPKIVVWANGDLYANLNLPNIVKGEKLLYSSQDNELYLRKQKTDGSFENLFKHQYIDLNNRNIFKLPKGTCEVNLVAENNIINAKVNIYKQFKVV